MEGTSSRELGLLQIDKWEFRTFIQLYAYSPETSQAPLPA
jgi:hypothetical protein